MLSYKKLLKKFLLITFFFVSVIVISLFIYDPLHIYHKSWVTNDDRFFGNIRLQAAGIINNYDFDSIILGTSMMKGSSAQEASDKLGGHFVNISADGSDLYERNVLLKHALRQKDIKQVIFSLDTGLDLNLRTHNKKYPLNKFDYLYDSNPINDLKVYWNDKYLKCLLSFSTSPSCIGDKRSLVRPQKWFDRIYSINKSISGLENWTREKGRGKNVYHRVIKHLDKPLTEDDYERLLRLTYKIIDETILETVQKNKDVSFHIVFPPYSRFLFSLWKQRDYQKYRLYIKTIEYFVEQSLKNPNMRIYAFDNIDYIADLNNYRDMRHYNLEMNKMIVEYISGRKYIKNTKELNTLIEKMDILNSNYDVSKEINYILDKYKVRTHLSQTMQQDKKLSVEGWILADRVNKVELWRGNKMLRRQYLTENKEIYDKYPQYKQLKNSFKLNDIAFDDKLELIFKYKNKIVEKINIAN
jgi:hypothetical protein